MYYSSGNYEAFAHPRKPEGVDDKSAYIIGSGLAALTAACYLVRDGQMKGERIHVFEKDPLPGGACDGYKYDIGYVMRGGREMDNHFEVMWDLLRSIPSLETEGASVLDEYYWLNKEDPNTSLCRATEKRGPPAPTDGKFAISEKGAKELMKLNEIAIVSQHTGSTGLHVHAYIDSVDKVSKYLEENINTIDGVRGVHFELLVHQYKTTAYLARYSE